MQSAEIMAEYLDLADKSHSVREAKAHFSDILAQLDEGPALVKVHGKPRAIIMEAHQYQALLAKAEAYEVLAAYQLAKQEPSLSLEQFNQSMDALLDELAVDDGVQ